MLIAKLINVEYEDWNYLKSLNINVSEVIRGYLHNLVASKKMNPNDIDIELERIKVSKILENMGKMQSELQKSQQIIQQFEENTNKTKEEQLKMEKEKIEKMSKCTNCGGALTDKNTIELKNNVFLCKSCFYNKETARRYLNK
jgi:succinate dehydrogenase/fumarate reductase-like Fe-S protein